MGFYTNQFFLLFHQLPISQLVNRSMTLFFSRAWTPTLYLQQRIKFISLCYPYWCTKFYLVHSTRIHHQHFHLSSKNYCPSLWLWIICHFWLVRNCSWIRIVWIICATNWRIFWSTKANGNSILHDRPWSHFDNILPSLPLVLGI